MNKEISDRVIVIAIGLSFFSLGIYIYTKNWFVSPLFSSLFILLGAQITLWAIGIKSEFLGNIPNVFSFTNNDIERDSKYEYELKERYSISMFGSSYYELEKEYEKLHYKMEILEKIKELKAVEREEADIRGYNYKPAEEKLIKMTTTTYDKTYENYLNNEERRERRHFYGSVKYHLDVALRILEDFKDFDEVSNHPNFEEAVNTFKNEIIEIHNLVCANPSLVYGYGKDHTILPDFIQKTAYLRYSSKIQPKRELIILTELNEYLNKRDYGYFSF